MEDPSVPSSEISVDIYFVPANHHLNYGVGPPLPQSSSPFQMKHGYSDRIPATQKAINLDFEEALRDQNLLTFILKASSASSQGV